MCSAMTVPSVSLPTRSAAAASPLPASSALPGNPVRTSDVTTSAAAVLLSARPIAPSAERTDPLRSSAGISRSRRSAAWTVVAFVLSRYAGATVENSSISGFAFGTARSASRAASTPIVVVSSSYEATVRVPLPPPLPTTLAISVRSSRRYGR